MTDPTWVAYVDGAIRVAERKSRVGSAASGQIFTYTATTKVVTVDVRADRMAWAVRGTAVTIRLPDGGIVEGTVAAVGTEASGSDGAPPGRGDRAGDDRAGRPDERGRARAGRRWR